MTFKSCKIAIIVSVMAILLLPLFTNKTVAKSKVVYSFSLIGGIDNDTYRNMNDRQKINALTKQLNRKSKLLDNLASNIRNRKELSNINDLFDKYTIRLVKENLDQQIKNILIDMENEKDPLQLSLDNYKSKKIIYSDQDSIYGSIEENIKAQVSQFVFDKSNIIDANILYKINHNTTLTGVLKKALSYNNNIDILARRWNNIDINASYDQISETPNDYEKNIEIENYLTCINLSDALCENHPGKSKLVSNVEQFIVNRIEELRIKKFEDEFLLAKEKLSESTHKLWVTSYNAACSQTKGGIMGKDGNCYGTETIPCAIGSNKGKTEGLCGNPYIGAKGHNLKDMMEEGNRPLAVTQDLKYLIGQNVYLRCYDKKGDPFYDERCNGYFTIYDYKNKRYKDSVDIFVDEKNKDGKYNNIGGVDVEIYYDPNLPSTTK